MTSNDSAETPTAGKSRPSYQFILDRVKSYHGDADLDLIRRACDFSNVAHEGEVRRSGKPFVTHPLRVAHFLAEMNMDAVCVAAGALHDTLENTTTTLGQLHELFGDEVATLVQGVTNLSKAEGMTKEEKRAGGFRQMIEAMQTDVRVLFIKLCDRLHNMQTLGAMPIEARYRIARETLDLYVPLAARFGIYWLWRELEDLSFRYLEPERYQSVKALRSEAIKKLQPYEGEVVSTLKGTLEVYRVKAVVKPRLETVYRIFQRIVSENTSFEKLIGVIYFRILVTEVLECYLVLGAVNSVWQMVPGSFKDYVQKPKANQYQSLHTVVFGPQGRQVQLQIRTREMDRICERGVTAQWSPDLAQSLNSYYAAVTALIRELTEAEKENQDPLHFARSVTEVLYADEVRVLTPKGDVKELPKGATVLDFAYEIHTQLGNRCVGAIVHGTQVSPDHELHGGDVVEILTSDSHEPEERWMNFAKTLKAKRKIRQFLRGYD
jgi:GTP diphosphokinase / guanosine-3',5'-bis(diphosphate) 3'-diphosphatase